MALGAAPGREDLPPGKTLFFRLEIYGGFAAMQAADLNLLAAYYNAYPLFFYSGQYDFLQAQSGGLFTFSESRSGDNRLKTIRHGFPGGVRLSYVLSRGLSISVGLEYFQQNRLSSTSIRYQIEDRSGGLIQTTAAEVALDYPDFFLGVSAWIPQVGIRLAKPLGRRWQLGGSLSAGPLLARCRSVVETGYRFQYVNGYWSESHYLLEMKGSATGWAVDLSAELRRRLGRRWSVFLAPGYAWRRAAHVEGSGRNQSLAFDSNAVKDLVENAWQGRWQKTTDFSQRYWGTFSQTYYGNYFGDSEATDNFVLDLSGFQVKAGFSWAF